MYCASDERHGWKPRLWCPATKAYRIELSCSLPLQRRLQDHEFSRRGGLSQHHKAFQQLGVTIERPDTGLVVVYGSHEKLVAPEGEIDCGNSGTTMRLSGILAAQLLATRLLATIRSPSGRCAELSNHSPKWGQASPRSERTIVPPWSSVGAPAWHHLQPADGQRPGQERDSLCRSLRTRGHDGGRAVSKSRSYRTDARVFSRQASTRGGPH